MSTLCHPVWWEKLCKTHKEVLTSSQLGTLFSFSLILSHNMDSCFHAILSKICSSIWLRCFTTSRQRPSSALMKTSITCKVDNYGQNNILDSYISSYRKNSWSSRKKRLLEILRLHYYDSITCCLAVYQKTDTCIFLKQTCPVLHQWLLRKW